jgi:hypothetical protein
LAAIRLRQSIRLRRGCGEQDGGEFQPNESQKLDWIGLNWTEKIKKKGLKNKAPANQ